MRCQLICPLVQEDSFLKILLHTPALFITFTKVEKRMWFFLSGSA